jgi:Planctomycete cytochrome C
MARPHTPPPPGSPYYRPEVPPVVQHGPVQPAVQFVELEPLAPAGWRQEHTRWTNRLPGIPEPVLLAAIAVICMGAGWFFFQGPGSNLFGGRGKDPTTSTAVAEAAKPAKTEHEQEPALVPADRKPRPNPMADKTPPPDRPAPQPMPKPVPPPLPVGQPGLTFEKNVLPIFEAKCITCHGGGKKRGGLDVRSIAALLKGGDNGTSLVRGAPEKSLVWETIFTNRMPPGQNKLSAAEKKLVQEWIAGGAR